MSGLSEHEILSKHREALGEARKACLALAQNADPERAAPRGRHYTALRKAIRELEGSCRQMSYHREDTRWTRLGVIYAKALRTIQSKFVGQRWGYFGELVKLFETGERRLLELQMRTGTRGPILPKRTDWLILPDQFRISQGALN